MDIQLLTRHFERIGARLMIEIASPTDRRFRSPRLRDPDQRRFVLDVQSQRRGEVFALAVRADTQATVDFVPIDVQPKLRHLLLMARQSNGPIADRKQKILCGHDERHWFVAGVSDGDGIVSVYDAMEALKPDVVRATQFACHLSNADRLRRHTAAFIRQGEWFFVPRPDFEPDARLILYLEPIRRSGSKPHVVEQLYRRGGVSVYVHRKYPTGLTESQYRDLIARQPEAQSWPWQLMRRDMEVYARGKVRHPDHATIDLPGWHLVVMSAERRSENVVFLD